MSNRKSSIEWLVNELNQKIDFIPMDKWDKIRDIVQQAKEMHKEEIIDAYSDGAKGGANGGKGQHKDGWVSIQMKEKYYNKTFGK